jgi:hypothetical protein
MLELPALVLGLWCGAVRWEYDTTFMIFSTRTGCFAGDVFLQLDKRQILGPYATCDVTKVEPLGTKRWKSSNEMAFSVWGNCRDQEAAWEQKLTLLENGYLKVHSSWIIYAPGFVGRRRSIVWW